MYLKSINSINTSIFVLVLLSTLPSFSLSGKFECDDDPGYTFGTYVLSGNRITRTCAWLTEDSFWSQGRIDSFCKDDVIDKCPETCKKLSCEEFIGSLTCFDLSPSDVSEELPFLWHDITGEEYNCNYYSNNDADECRIFGDGYANFGWTANEACCACGGGINKD